MSCFPSCFPENFEKDILPFNAHYEDKNVYRIMKKGYIDRDGFISTFEEIKRGMIPPKNKLNDLDNPSLYGTSCEEDLSRLSYVLKILSGHHPAAIIAKGTIHSSCGPWQITSERTGGSSTHVDWWVYDDSLPQEYFMEIEDNET